MIDFVWHTARQKSFPSPKKAWKAEAERVISFQKEMDDIKALSAQSKAERSSS